MSNVYSSVWCAICCVVAVPACSNLDAQHARPNAIQRPALAVHHVAQLGYGATASFGLCLPPACPGVTPKHRASTPPAVESQVVPPDAPDAEQTLRVPRLPQTNVLTVYFASGQATLDAKSRKSIDALLANGSPRRVQIHGHTDSIGTNAQNTRIAQRRAAAVSRYMRTNHALTGVVLELEAMPLCCYVAENDDAAGRRLNRRVDIALVSEEKQGAP